MEADNSDLAKVIEGITSSGVPFIARPPEGRSDARGLILLWHGADPPRSEEALAAVLPLPQLPCWRVYLGMPLYGRRSPEGGFDEIMRRAAQDAVTQIFHPSIHGAVDEFPQALDDIRTQLSIDRDLPLGLFGFSQGGAAALLTLARNEFPFRAAVTFGAVVDLRAVVDALAAFYSMNYEWTAERLALAESLSTAQRARDLADSRAALLLAVGADDPYPMREPAEALADSIQQDGGTAEVAIILGIPHVFVDPPGEQATPQGSMARAIEEVVSDWLSRYFN